MGFFSALKELGDILKQGVDELGEIMTDGFVEMVIKGKDDYKTSYEKMEIANNIVFKAMSAYKEAYENTTMEYSKTKEELNLHIEYKKQLYKGVLAENQNTVNDLLKINLDEYVVKESIFGIDISYLNDYKKSLSDIFSFNNSFYQFSSTMGLALLSGFETEWLASQRQRIEAAEDALEDAKDYRAKVNSEVEKLNCIKSKLKLIREKIKEEKGLIDKLIEKLEQITISLKETNVRIAKLKEAYEKKNGFSKVLYKFRMIIGNKPDEQLLKEEEKEKVLANIEISKMLSKVINTQFITVDFDVTMEYDQMLQEMKELGQQIDERGI